MKIHKTKLVLPSYFASYLVNGDVSGIEPEERRALDLVLKMAGVSAGACASCGDEYFARRNDFSPPRGERLRIPFPDMKRPTLPEVLSFLAAVALWAAAILLSVRAI